MFFDASACLAVGTLLQSVLFMESSGRRLVGVSPNVSFFKVETPPRYDVSGTLPMWLPGTHSAGTARNSVSPSSSVHIMHCDRAHALIIDARVPGG